MTKELPKTERFETLMDQIPDNLIGLWEALADREVLEIAAERAGEIRENLLPRNQVAVRKTIGITDVGCSVNCAHCTVSEVASGTKNRNKLLDNLEGRLATVIDQTTNKTAIELVAYWPGLSGENTGAVEALQAAVRVASSERMVGADLGVIRDQDVLETLSDAGLTYLQNNLETTRAKYPERLDISSTRFDLKIATLKQAVQAHLKATSGILIGIGEDGGTLAELGALLRDNSLSLDRVAVNMMNYSTNDRVATRYSEHANKMTHEYAMRVLTFLRLALRANQSLIAGSGVGEYIQTDDREALRLIDTVHVGGFLNFTTGASSQTPYEKLDRIGMSVVNHPIL